MTRLRTAGVSIGALVMVAATAAFCAAWAENALSITAIVAFIAGLGIAFGSILGVPGWKPDAATPGGPDLWDRTGTWVAEHGALGAVLVVTLIIAAVHANVFLGEPYGDDLTFHMAESKRIADCLAVGDLDFWNPSANGGYASAYYYQVLPQLASAIPSAIFGHHLFWFQLSIFLPLVLAPAAAYRGMRLLGCTPWQSAVAAACACLMNGESRWGSGNAGTFQVGLYTQTWALAAFPLALGHGVRWVRDRQGLAPSIAWGVFVGLCHPFAGIALGLALFAGLVVQLRTLVQLSPMVRKWAWVSAGVLVLAFGILLEIVECTDLDLLGLEALRSPDDFVGLYIMPGIPMLIGGVWIYRALVAEYAQPTHGTEAERTVIGQFGRICLLGALLAVATMPGWITLAIDYKGFGGFPHRVNDEVGPGLVGLLVGRKDPGFTGYFHGDILDFGYGAHILTWGMPLVWLFARDRKLSWLWAPAALFAVFLAAGPHLGKSEDDLFPMVRFLGAMQTCLALGTGAGVVWIATWLGTQPEDAPMIARVRRWLFGRVSGAQVLYGLRTAIAAAAAALCVLLVAGGSTSLGARVNVLERSNPARIQMMTIIAKLRELPQGRKQVGPGCENHWWNLLSWVYGARPSTLQMGGGGLQASPNYDFLWNDHEYKKTAWLYDAPYVVVGKDKGKDVPGDEVFSTEEYVIKKLPSPGFVSPIQITGSLPDGKHAAHVAALEWLKGDSPIADLMLAYAPGVKSEEPRATVTGAREQLSPGDDPDVVANVDVTRQTSFVLRESWHPRWHAYIDGEETQVHRVTPDFPAIDVPAGKHLLAFRFERPWWAQASWLMWPLVVFGAWLGAKAAGRSNRRPFGSADAAA